MTYSARLGTMDDTDRGAVAEPLSGAAAPGAEGPGDPADVLAAARPMSERARRERAMAAYDAGHRDGYDRRPRTPTAHGYTAGADLKAYAGGYGDGCQLREDERLERFEHAYPDGGCTAPRA